jgi:hypothetical protein
VTNTRTTRYRRNRNARRNQRANNNTWGQGRPNWTQEELGNTLVHCDTCHFTHAAIDTNWCTPFPGLDANTCSTCNKWNAVDPIKVYPLLALASLSINHYLAKVVKYVDEFDYLPFWQRVPFYFTLTIAAAILVKNI